MSGVLVSLIGAETVAGRAPESWCPRSSVTRRAEDAEIGREFARHQVVRLDIQGAEAEVLRLDPNRRRSRDRYGCLIKPRNVGTLEGPRHRPGRVANPVTRARPGGAPA